MIHTGTIDTFNPERGWGFIKREGQRDIWFHANDIEGGLREPVVGDRVSFDVAANKKGPKATRIIILKP